MSNLSLRMRSRLHMRSLPFPLGCWLLFRRIARVWRNLSHAAHRQKIINHKPHPGRRSNIRFPLTLTHFTPIYSTPRCDFFTFSLFPLSSSLLRLSYFSRSIRFACVRKRLLVLQRVSMEWIRCSLRRRQIRRIGYQISSAEFVLRLTRRSGHCKLTSNSRYNLIA